MQSPRWLCKAILSSQVHDAKLTMQSPKFVQSPKFMHGGASCETHSAKSCNTQHLTILSSRPFPKYLWPFSTWISVPLKVHTIALAFWLVSHTTEWKPSSSISTGDEPRMVTSNLSTARKERCACTANLVKMYISIMHVVCMGLKSTWVHEVVHTNACKESTSPPPDCHIGEVSLNTKWHVVFGFPIESFSDMHAFSLMQWRVVLIIYSWIMSQV